MQEMQETQIWSLGQEDPLEKEMVTHSTVLAWKISQTEEQWTHTHTHTNTPYIYNWSEAFVKVRPQAFVMT